MGRRRFATANVTTAFMLGATFVGCAHATSSPATSSGAAGVSSAGSWVRSVSMPPVSIVESPTVSYALDRIDQREAELDNRYERRGTGAGVTVYVFDGGVSTTHPELAGRVRRGYSAFPDDAAVCNAHGTAVAGAIGGRTLGVAPEVEIVDVKMVDCSRLRGTIQGIVDGARWVLADAARHPGRRAIANWSFIADTAAAIPALDSAVQALTRAGIAVVVSAGNATMNACRVSPANAPGTIVVGATALYRDASGHVYDRRAPNTAFGPCIDVYAPGDSVMLPSLGGDEAPSAQLWNGTSMSAGYVSGAAALFLQARPAATPLELANHIRSSATRNVILDSRSSANFMLYVGAADPLRERMRVSAR